MSVYNMSADYDYLVKCLIIGDSGTGKSAMMVRFADDVYNPEYISTVGVDFKIKTIEHRNKTLKMQIWDTAGQERFRAITTTFYRGCQTVIVCYDISDRNTFINVNKWIDQINPSKSAILVLCGTKSDLTSKRQVSESEGEEYAKSKNMMFIETSAKNNSKVSELFRLISSAVIDKHIFEGVETDIKSTTNISIQPSTSNSFCNC